MADRGVGGTKSPGTVLRTSVATLYSNLVTRPTGRAVRLAIETQLAGIEGICLSVLDFTNVGVVDFSCADEVIAKLLIQYSGDDRPSDTFFLAIGVAEHHRDSIEAALHRRNRLLVAIGAGARSLWGPAPPRLRSAWSRLDDLGPARAEDFASRNGLSHRTADAWLRRLVEHRVAIPDGRGCVCTLPALVGVSVGLDG